MPSLKDDGFEVVGVASTGIKRPVGAATRQSTRTKLPPIPKAKSPSSTPVVEALGLNADHPSKRVVTGPVKRKRSTSNASQSRHGYASSSDERDELEEVPSRRYKKPSPTASRASPAKGKARTRGKLTDKEEKPKKVSKASLERAKLDELRKDKHFGKLDDATIKRIAKVSLERMYLINRFRNGEQLKEEFDISGSKGNVYKVTLDRQVKCSCMDFTLRRQVCKHLMFVYLKVLRLEGHLPVFSRIKLTEDEVEQVFDEALENPVAHAMAHPELRKAWAEAVGYVSEEDAASGSNETTVPSGKRLVPEEGDVCGVCYEDLEPGSTEGLEFCLESCGRPIHTDCLETWFNTRGFDRTCIWCRARWHDVAKAKDKTSNGYGIGVGARGSVVDASGRQLNLAAAAGLDAPVVAEPAAEPAPGTAAEAAIEADAVADTSGWE